LSVGKAAIVLDGYALSDIGKTVLGAGVALVIYLQVAERFGWSPLGSAKEKSGVEVSAK
jgi:hypothetical protein